MSARQEIADLQRRLNLNGIPATWNDAARLRKDSMILRRWYELECGSDHGCIERDEETGKTYWYNPTGTGRRSPTPDRETPALKRVSALCKSLSAHFYNQTDPRGCAIYVSTEPLTDSDYNRGVAVF